MSHKLRSLGRLYGMCLARGWVCALVSRQPASQAKAVRSLKTNAHVGLSPLATSGWVGVCVCCLVCVLCVCLTRGGASRSIQNNTALALRGTGKAAFVFTARLAPATLVHLQICQHACHHDTSCQLFFFLPLLPPIQKFCRF